MTQRYLEAVTPCLLAVLLAVSPALAQTLVDPDLEIETIVQTPFNGPPVTMAFIGDDDFLLLWRASGQVRRVVGGVLLPDPVLDVAVNVALDERGLLGIDTDPDFINNGYVYLYYTESSTGDDTSDAGSIPLGNRVYRYTWNGSFLVDARLVLDLPVTPGMNHNGGIVLFGPDDMLYVVIGDLNHQGRLQNLSAGNAPDDTGVIFRVHANGTGAVDNPFFNPDDTTDPMNRYYAYGVRNSFGMAFDPLTGVLWDTENGKLCYDEVNRVLAGFNSGWLRIMGPVGHDPGSCSSNPPIPGPLWDAPGSVYSDPEFSWLFPVAPTAIRFVGTRKLGCDLEHDVLVASANCGKIYRFELDASRTGLSFGTNELQDLVADNDGDPCQGEQAEIVFGSDFGAVSDMKIGPDGALYVVSHIPDRAVYRISLADDSLADSDGDEVDDACDCDPADPTAYAPPEEVPRIRVSGSDPTRLGWDSQTATSGSGVDSTLVSVNLSSLQADVGFDSACRLGTALTTPQFIDSRPAPAPGDAYFYLVRSRNSCLVGTFGDGSGAPDPRDALDAAVFPDCM